MDSIKEEWGDRIKELERVVNELLKRDRPSKILLVEDDQSDLAFTVRLLKDFNCTVFCCSTPSQAIQKLKSEWFDLVLMDQVLPGMTGIELIKQTMPKTPGSKFFLVTGFPNSEIVSETLKLGALFIPKPLTKSALGTFLRPKHE